MCPVFNLSSNLSICFRQFPNPFVLFITFKSNSGVDYNGAIFQIAIALGNIVCKLSTIVIIKKCMNVTCKLKDPRYNIYGVDMYEVLTM